MQIFEKARIAGGHLELDLPVRGDDQDGGSRGLADDAPAAGVVEPPLPVEGGDPDPQLRARGERVDARLGVEGGGDEPGGDRREYDRVDRLADLGLAAIARHAAPTAPIARARAKTTIPSTIAVTPTVSHS